MSKINFINDKGDFSINNPENYTGLYFPIAGEMGLKSAVSPNFGGDSKIDQNSFLYEPVSIENLHNNKSGRNFWCIVEGIGAWSAVGLSAEDEYNKFTPAQDETKLSAGFMTQTLVKKSVKYGLTAENLIFCPVDDNVEVMNVKITNTSDSEKTITPVAAIPIYARSADNIRDHRHVTSLLHRIRTTDSGVFVKPTLSFDERGHQVNKLTYFVCGVSGKGEKPVSYYPVIDSFIGEGGDLLKPLSIINDLPGVEAGSKAEGKEALGGIRFEKITLRPGESVSYTIIPGITDNEDEVPAKIARFSTEEKVMEEKSKLRDYWQEKVNVSYHTSDVGFDNFMKWVSFQPILRRIYGCSFLPHHDYGRGGRGYRDLWQDCLSLLIMDPDGVRSMLVSNYGGVRLDGSNATIIGSRPGEFKADRNGIARVWMDHGVWPFMTTLFYINQTGDVDLLKEESPYFFDEDGLSAKGSVLEHILIQNLCAFYEVGSHNHMRLRGADWNDALDMAEKNGESVAFTCAYAGNLLQLSELLTMLKAKKGWTSVKLLPALKMLFTDDVKSYDSIEAKKNLVAEYKKAVLERKDEAPEDVDIDLLATNLKAKAEWIMEHVRNTEWIKGDEDNLGWFNSYYDNDMNRVEGYFENGVRMMLTGQVFAIMSQTAKDEQVANICRSADKYLYKKEAGGYRLNTDFKENKFNLGRMFGFAYGEKENGAVFSHMTVMYANALYKRGFVREGYKALQTLADTAINFETSRIYPGIPEYFNAEGRGLYHYLTGAASWYMLTMITEVFGVRGEYGDFVVMPKLVKEQFDKDKTARLSLMFAGKKFTVTIHNKKDLDYGEYKVGSASCNNGLEIIVAGNKAVIDRSAIEKSGEKSFEVEVELV